MTTKEFIQYASERQELCEKLSVCTEAEEAFALAKGEGLTDSREEFVKVMEATKSALKKVSDEDLESVNAAGNTTVISLYTGTASALVSTGAAAAAAI